VNTRLKNNDLSNFWDNGPEETKQGEMSLSMSVANHKRRAASALGRITTREEQLEKPNKNLNKTVINDSTLTIDGKIKRRIVLVVRRSRSRNQSVTFEQSRMQ